MQYRNLLLLCLLSLGLPLGLTAQILDDSTKQVYGPTTTSFIREGDIYYQTGQEYHPDTLVRNFYRFLPVERSGYRLQNLGNIGTAQQSIFYTLPDEIGARAGFDVYDIWFNEPAEIKYYNSRSPYTSLFYSQGGNGRSWVDVTHSRNITPRWNAGVDFRRLTSDKQIGPLQRRDDKQTVSTAYDLFTRYQDKQDRYQLMANLSRLKHSVEESGGIALTAPEPENINDIIAYQDSPIRLPSASSSVLRINYHLYHQYKLLNALQLYHIIDRETRTDSYADLAPTPAYYHVAMPGTPPPITEDFKTRQLNNQAGVKGAYGIGQWNAYAKHRYVRFTPTPGKEVYRENELAVGGYLALQPDTLRTLRVEAELRTEGQYLFEALAQNRWLTLRYQRSKYKPAFIYEYRNTQVDSWNQDFLDPVVDRLEGSLAIQLGPLRLMPSLQLSVIQNPLYFRANPIGEEFSEFYNAPYQRDVLTPQSRILNIKPVQGTAAQMISPRLGYALQLGNYFHWDGEVVYTQVTGRSASAFQVPEWLINSSIYIEGPMFGGNMIGQLGIDVHLKSSYYADAYDPTLRQFVVQQDFLVPSYPIANLFFGFKIKYTRVFARLSHLNEGVPEVGYFVTPYYNGIQRTFDLGIEWLFFD